MHKLIRSLTVALLVCTGPVVHATVLNFDAPTIIDIDGATNQAVYHEAGFNLAGDAATFLTVDGIGTNMTGGLVLVGGSTISLMETNGNLFSFLGLDAGLLQPGSAGSLTITGIFGDNSQQNILLALADLGTLSLTPWAGLTALRFSGTDLLVLDNVVVNVSTVPEPNSLAMLLLGMGSLTAMRRAGGKKSGH